MTCITRHDIVLLAFVLLLLPLLRFFIAQTGGYDLHFDEAQYWEWSQHLDWSYYSKGPLVAWLIALSTYLFGHGEWQVRLFAWLTYDVFLVLLFIFTCQFWKQRKPGWWAVVLGLTTPLYFPLGQVMTTDVLLLACWTWALWASWRALYRYQATAWYELGIAIGIGGLAKLSIGMLPFFLGLGLLLTAKGRRVLCTWPPWGGVLLTLLLMSPVLLWNANHDWVMFRHEQGHILGVGKAIGGWEQLGEFLEFVGGQLLVLSPLVAVAMARTLGHPPRSAEQRLLWYLSLAVLTFFLLKAVGSKVQVNWPAPAYIGLLVLFAGQIDTLHRQWRWSIIAGMIISVLLIILAFFPMLMGLSPAKAPFKELRSWRQPIQAVEQQADTVQFLMVPNYHLAGSVAFYWSKRLPVYPLGEHRRFSQHDFWPGISQDVGRDGLFIATGKQLPPTVSAAFTDCQSLLPVPATTCDGQIVRTLYSWHCRDYRSTNWARPTTY